jgi:large subunit ribosomal protein L10
LNQRLCRRQQGDTVHKNPAEVKVKRTFSSSIEINGDLCTISGSLFYYTGVTTGTNFRGKEETLLAISKARKEELVAQYADLLDQSNGFIIVQYGGLSVKRVDDLRAKIREVNGKYVVTKTTLLARALQQQGWPVPDDFLTGPTAVAFGMDNLPGVAKAVLDFTGDAEIADRIAVTGGVMTGNVINAKQVEVISKLPTLDELRAQLIGLIVQPATGLVNVLYSATGQIVNVLQAYIDDRGEGDAA